MKRTMMCFTFIFFVLSLFISSGKPMARDHNAIILEEYTSYEINEKYIQVNTDSNFLDTKEIKFDFQDIIKQYSIVENNYHYYGYGTYFAKRDLKYDNSSSMRIDTINRDSKDMENNRIYSYNLDEHENTIYLCYEPTFTDTYYIETSGTNNIILFYKVKETNPQTNLDWTLKSHANGYNSLNVNLIGGRIYYIMITNNSKTNKSIDISITR